MTESKLVDIPEIGEVVPYNLFDEPPEKPELITKPGVELDPRELAAWEKDRDRDFARRMAVYELLKHVRLGVELIDRDEFLAWQRELDRMNVEERTKVRENPGRVSLLDDKYRTAWIEHRIKLLKEGLAWVEGLSHGGIDLKTVKDKEDRARRIQRMGLLMDFVSVVERAQTPTPRQRDCLPGVGELRSGAA